MKTLKPFPEYKPPLNELGKCTKEPLKFSKLLSVYKNIDIINPLYNKWIYAFIESNNKKRAVIIYDRFPKGSMHLLLLPTLKNFPECPKNFTSKDLKKLQALHKIARLIAESLENNYNKKFILGYHVNPSMEDLHIHIVSDDITDKHRDSYTNDKKFLPIDFVEEQLQSHDNLLHLYSSNPIPTSPTTI